MNNYVKTGHRKAWVCFDLDNGHKSNKNDAGKGYVWVFTTRKEARAHCRNQKKLKHSARLSQPIKVEII